MELWKVVAIVVLVIAMVLGGMNTVKQEWEAYVSQQVGQACTIENMYDVNDIQNIEC